MKIYEVIAKHMCEARISLGGSCYNVVIMMSVKCSMGV